MSQKQILLTIAHQVLEAHNSHQRDLEKTFLKVLIKEIRAMA